MESESSGQWKGHPGQSFSCPHKDWLYVDSQQIYLWCLFHWPLDALFIDPKGLFYKQKKAQIKISQTKKFDQSQYFLNIQMVLW